MEINYHEFEGRNPNKQLFLHVIAMRVCEMSGYDLYQIGKIQAAVSNTQSHEVKSMDGSSHKEKLSFYDALELFGPEYIGTIKEAQRDIVGTIKRSVGTNKDQKIYHLLEEPNSARFGQDLSIEIGNVLRQKMTGST